MAHGMCLRALLLLMAGFGSAQEPHLPEDCIGSSDIECADVSQFPVFPSNYQFRVSKMSVSPSAKVCSLDVPPRSLVFPVGKVHVRGKTAKRDQRLTLHADSFAGVEEPYLRRLAIEDLQVDELPRGFLRGLEALELINTGLDDVVAAVDRAADEREVRSNDTALGGMVPADRGVGQPNDTSLYALKLSDSGDGLVKLPNGSFPALGPRLRELALPRNPQFTTIEDGAFRYMRRLRVLDLSVSALRDLPEDVFAPLYRLQSLNLRGNALRRLSPRAVAPLRNLRRLNLADNELSALPRHVFRLSANLREVDLRRNRLTVFAHDLFDATRALAGPSKDDGARDTDLYNRSAISGVESGMSGIRVDGNPLDCRLLEHLAARRVVGDEAADDECLLHDEFLQTVYPDIFGERQKCDGGSLAVCRIQDVGIPVYHRYTGTFWGTWMRDPAPPTPEDSTKYWIAKHFDGSVLFEYPDKEAFLEDRHSKRYMLPTLFEGNGHVVYKGSFYYHDLGTPDVVRFDLYQERKVAQVPLPDAAFDQDKYIFTTDYNYFDFAVDENGLWVIYGETQRTTNMLVAKLEVLSQDPYLRVQRVWNITFNPRTVGNAFIACGVLYTVKSVNERDTEINFVFDLYQNKIIPIKIPFRNAYGMNNMVSYNPREKVLYAWDKGNQMTYPLKFDTQLG